MKKILIILFAASFSFFCAAGDSTPDSAQTPQDDVLITAEEKIQNKLFDTQNEIHLNSPGHDMVKALSFLNFERSVCADYQVTIIASERILIDNGQISNYQALIAWNQTNNGTAITTLALSNFYKVINGDITNTVFTGADLTLGTRYYWASWSYSDNGELLCSSPQYAFYIR